MKNKKEWETKSLEWIHRVREEMDREIQKTGLSPAQWIKERGIVDVERICKSLGLNNVKVSKKQRKTVSI
ncbi:MAG: hypothetical protein ACE5K3_10040 [bacterium]